MDAWILKQLRGQVLTDLGDLIPQNYFNTEVPWATLDQKMPGAKHWSFELKWGYLAGTLGQELYFRPVRLMSARQVSAAEMLMHLGLLAASEAMQSSCAKLSEAANALQVSDGNSGVIAANLKNEGLPTLRNNVKLGLKQYVKYLSKDEAEPFLPLLKSGTPSAGRFL